MFIFLMSAGYAAGSKLIISDVDVTVGSKTDRGINNGETISEEAKPGDTVKFKIEVKSNFTSSDNIDIEDVTVEVTIEDIDDGDDLDDESNEFDLSPGRDKRVTLEFKVPEDADEDDFDVLIEAEGKDENRTTHRATMRIRLEVEKERHLIKITRKTLTPSEVACGRRNVQVGLTVLNQGRDEEDDVSVRIFNEDLGFDIKEQIGVLSEDPDDDNNQFSKTYSFNVANNAEEGSYPVTLRVLYDDDRRKAEETLTLTVNKCGTAKEEETEEDVTVVTPPARTPAQPSEPAPLPPDTTVTSESFFKSNAFVIAVIIAEVIAVIIGIVLIVALFARRD